MTTTYHLDRTGLPSYREDPKPRHTRRSIVSRIFGRTFVAYSLHTGELMRGAR